MRPGAQGRVRTEGRDEMSDEKAGTSRRDFLRLAATGAPAVAVTAVAGTTAEAAAGPEAPAEGLRRTAHVKKYLETARF